MRIIYLTQCHRGRDLLPPSAVAAYNNNIVQSSAVRASAAFSYRFALFAAAAAVVSVITVVVFFYFAPLRPAAGCYVVYIRTTAPYRGGVGGQTLTTAVDGRSRVSGRRRRAAVDGQNGNRPPMFTCDKRRRGRVTDEGADRHATITDQANSGTMLFVKGGDGEKCVKNIIISTITVIIIIQCNKKK